MRKTYGYKTYKMLELSLYHAVGKLPEPELNHRFFNESFLFICPKAVEQKINRCHYTNNTGYPK